MIKIVILLVVYCFSFAKYHNEAPYIVAQCYTKTIDKYDKKHNPCYSCHTKGKIPNYIDDSDLQTAYSFPEYATKNRWINLFKDRTKEIEKISDEEILKYIQKSNYIKDDKLLLANRLKNLPKKWDYNNNGIWDGYVPDCYFNFDKDGFDRDLNGNITGWVAFKYRPFLGTFWPTNGSTDDVMIRLPKPFYQNKNKQIDLDIYKQNLKILVDIITFKKEHKRYVGLAKDEKIALGLYPVGTEFLHSVRYIKPTKDGIELSNRLKELRYAKKIRWVTYWQHQELADEEFKESYDFPDRLEKFIGNFEVGFSNKRGWIYQGFIEDKQGELRPQNNEETIYCMGCHSNIGAITDGSFAFPRIVSFGYWDKKGLKGMLDKNDEYLKYLKNNNHANEFRTNLEVYNKFFKNGKLDEIEANKIKQDISYLLYPSRKRALKLNKAYKIIVDEQSYIYGRDAHIKPLDDSVYKKVEQDRLTKLKEVEND